MKNHLNIKNYYEKVGAVSQWRTVIHKIPSNSSVAQVLERADIHDAADRLMIEKIIEYEVGGEYYVMLDDAFRQLKELFDWH